MSPLVRSLLALAALLAAAQAEYDTCVTVLAGHNSTDLYPMDSRVVVPPGAVVHVPNNCADTKVGFEVKACSDEADGTRPKVNVNQNNLDRFSVWCRECSAGVSVDVVVYCDHLIGSRLG